ncbi:MAG: hypothetical protein KDD25_07165 [Bdellovibrionales bacterium]|nr:hypothetical protein [Bdellovibrionales bacterium]
MRLLAFVAAIGLTFVSTSYGQEQTSSIQLDDAKDISILDRFHGSLVLEYSTNTQNYSSEQKSESVATYIAPSVDLGKDWTVSALFGFSDERRSPDPVRATNTKVSLSIPKIALNEKLSLGNKANGYAPTNEKQRIDESYRGSAELESKLKLATRILRAPFETYYQIGGRQNFHQFDRSHNGVQNEKYRVTHTIGVSVEPIKKLTMSISGTFQQGISYFNRVREKYSATESLGVAVLSNLSVEIGHTNGDNAFGPDGKTSNISIYDKRTSQYFGNLNFSF